MGFCKVNEGGVEHDDGVSIQIKHHDYLLYQRGGRRIEISMGYAPSAREIYVYASEVKSWASPHGSELLSESEKIMLENDLKQGLGLLKGNFVLK